MTRRRALWLTGIAAGVLFWVLAVIDLRMWDAGGPGIVGFEIAGSEPNARDILAEWGDKGHDAAQLSLWLDFPFLILYAIFWSLAAAACREIARDQGWARLARLGGAAIPLAPIAAVSDALEDVNLLIALGGDGGGTAPALAAIFAVIKFVTLGLAELYVAVVVIRRLFGIAPRLLVAVIALGAALGALLLAVNVWTLERDTEPAKPDIGRILKLPQGEIQVREDGPRSGPPLVLIHGYCGSMRWWDDVVPALARENRVIRIDLLGHGGSEKPRDGYSMENQADVMASAMRALGVRRAALVGHSMGGTVVTAFAERHRGMVSRLMMIGTSSDTEDGEGSPIELLAYLPVTGHVADRFATDRSIRVTLERFFAPAFDPPDLLVHDIKGRTTWNVFRDSVYEHVDYLDERPLHERLASTGVPLTVILGEEENHTPRSTRLYNSVPNARTVVMEGLHHVPFVEAPGRTAPLIAAFARG